jgi:hypothetical protein
MLHVRGFAPSLSATLVTVCGDHQKLRAELFASSRRPAGSKSSIAGTGDAATIDF